jgi:hypothetical protein
VEAKTPYFKALRAEVPELMKIATGKEERPPELDTFAALSLSLAKINEMTADQETLACFAKTILGQS